MSFRLVALDLDGTLLNRELAIPPAAAEVLQKVRERGVHVILVTGRMHCSALPYARELGLSTGPLISYNGALVKDVATGETHAHWPLSLEIAREITSFLYDRGLQPHVHIDDRVYVHARTVQTDVYSRISRVEAIAVGDLRDFLRETGEKARGADANPAVPTKMVLVEDEEVITGIQEVMSGTFGDRVYITRSYPFFLEMMSREASKAKALRFVAGNLGVSREMILAMGDGWNDMDMLAYAGCGVAMAHAPPEVRARACRVAPADPESGVARVLEELVLGAEP